MRCAQAAIAHRPDDGISPLTVVPAACLLMAFGGVAWGDWEQTWKLTADGAAAEDLFGSSVCVSGNTIVVGANADDDAGYMSSKLWTGKKGRKGVRKIFLASPAVAVESGHGTAATHHGAGACVSPPEPARDASASGSQR